MGILDILKRQSSSSSSSSSTSSASSTSPSSSSSSSPLRWLSSAKVRRESRSVPKGHIAVYVGEAETRKRFIVPIAFLSHPLFLELLQLAEEEFGYNPPQGALTIPCHEHDFIAIASLLI